MTLLIILWVALMVLWLIAAPLAFYLEYEGVRIALPWRVWRDTVLAAVIAAWDRLAFRLWLFGWTVSR